MDDEYRKLTQLGEAWALASDEENEAEFVARLVARDESAFNQLVLTYERRVFATVFRMLGRRDEAEDLSQEVFVQVFKAIDQFRGESKLSTWIYRIAVNLCKNRSKYNSRRHVGKQDDVDAMADRAAFTSAKGVSVGDTSRPDELVEGMQLEAVVKRAIDQIPPCDTGDPVGAAASNQVGPGIAAAGEEREVGDGAWERGDVRGGHARQ